jgi:hypothetical protein
MEQHIRAVGWLYIITGAFGLLLGAAAFMLLFGVGLLAADRDAITALTIIAACISGLAVLLSAPGILAGIGILRFQSWGRILGLILAVANLPSFPVGTALGVYALYALLDDDSSAIFNGERRADLYLAR